MTTKEKIYEVNISYLKQPTITGVGVFDLTESQYATLIHIMRWV